MIFEQVLESPWIPVVIPRRVRALLGIEGVSTQSAAVNGIASQRAVDPVPAACDAAGAGRGPILLVEDNLINQKVVLGLLRKRGYTVEVADDGQKALDVLSVRSFALVLMDVQMPVMDGLEATHRIRADERWAKLPIIAMTAHAMNGDRERCLQAGMNEYMSKPVDMTRLLALIEEFMA